MPSDENLIAPQERSGLTGRFVVGLAGLLLVGAMASWTLALFAATRPPAPLLIVFGPHPAVANLPIPFRVIAFDQEARKRAPVTGTISRAGRPVPLHRGHATLGGEPNGAISVAVDVVVNEAPKVLEVPLLVGGEGTSHSFGYERWHREVKDAGGIAVLPEHGQVSSFAPTSLILASDPMKQVLHAPSVLAAKAPDGRGLRLRRSPFQIELPGYVDPTATTVQVAINSQEAGPLYVDLFLDARLLNLTVLDVPVGKSEHQLALPASLKGKLWTIVVAPSPLARSAAQTANSIRAPNLSEASHALADLVSTTNPEATAEVNVARSAPLYPRSMATAALRAVASRFTLLPTKLSPIGPNRALQIEAEQKQKRAQIERWRAPFRASALGFICLAFLAAVLPALRTRKAQQQMELEANLEAEAPHDEEDEMPPTSSSLSTLKAQAIAAGALVVASGLLWVLDWSLRFVAGS